MASLGQVSALPIRLSGRYEGSFAYYTIRDRLPVIITKVVDNVCRSKAQFQHLGNEALDDIKAIAGALSLLRNHLQTDKPITLIDDGGDDVDIWNNQLNSKCNLGFTPSWFTSSWLYVECYMYRRITSAFLLSKHYKNYDWFGEQKRESLTQSMPAISSLSKFTLKKIQEYNLEDVSSARRDLLMFFQVSLWGNRCDLSISSGQDNSQTTDPLSSLHELHSYIISDHQEELWTTLRGFAETGTPAGRFDFVLDNAGFELFTDLCLAEYLLACGYTTEIHLHLKTHPWFVSDTTPADLRWTLDELSRQDVAEIRDLAGRWKTRLQDGSFVLREHKFWTTGHDFAQMNVICPDLYQDLSQSEFIIVKGDLNYRKGLGDRKWSHSLQFDQSLCGFLPSTLCFLRTLKCDLVTGLKPGQSERLSLDGDSWMVTGQYAVLQLAKQ